MRYMFIICLTVVKKRYIRGCKKVFISEFDEEGNLYVLNKIIKCMITLNGIVKELLQILVWTLKANIR